MKDNGNDGDRLTTATTTQINERDDDDVNKLIIHTDKSGVKSMRTGPKLMRNVTTTNGSKTVRKHSDNDPKMVADVLCYVLCFSSHFATCGTDVMATWKRSSVYSCIAAPSIAQYDIDEDSNCDLLDMQNSTLEELGDKSTKTR